MIDLLKEELRKKVRMLKLEFSLEHKKRKSIPIFELIESDRDFKRAKIIFAYWSLADEVYTHDFIRKWAKSKTILLPVVNGNNLLPDKAKLPARV